MSAWLLDTNILSELRRPQPLPAVIDFVSGKPLERLYVSEVTFAEIRFGIELVTDPSRRSEIRLWLENRLRPMFEGRVLPVTEEILLEWRLIIDRLGARRSRGNRRLIEDLAHHHPDPTARQHAARKRHRSTRR